MIKIRVTLIEVTENPFSTNIHGHSIKTTEFSGTEEWDWTLTFDSPVQVIRCLTETIYRMNKEEKMSLDKQENK